MIRRVPTVSLQGHYGRRGLLGKLQPLVRGQGRRALSDNSYTRRCTIPRNELVAPEKCSESAGCSSAHAPQPDPALLIASAARSVTPRDSHACPRQFLLAMSSSSARARQCTTGGCRLRPTRAQARRGQPENNGFCILLARRVANQLYKSLRKLIMGRGILLWMLGVPLPIILLLAMCSHG